METRVVRRSQPCGDFGHLGLESKRGELNDHRHPLQVVQVLLEEQEVVVVVVVHDHQQRTVVEAEVVDRHLCWVRLVVVEGVEVWHGMHWVEEAQVVQGGVHYHLEKALVVAVVAVGRTMLLAELE